MNVRRMTRAECTRDMTFGIGRALQPDFTLESLTDIEPIRTRRRLRMEATVGLILPALIALLFSLSRPAMAAVSQDEDKESKIRDSVVKVSASMRYPDLTHPWSKASPREASGTGVVIDGKRILTNAHVVLYASQLFVESYQSSEKLTAHVEAVRLASIWP